MELRCLDTATEGEKVETPLNGEGLLSRLDPRVKIAVFLPLAWTVALASNLFQVFSFLPLALLLFSTVYRKTFTIVKYLLFADFFLLFVVVTQLLFGSPYEGILIFFKSTVIVLFSLLLLTTSSVFDLLHALHHLKVPNKLLQLTFFFYRYLFTVKEQLQLALKSARSRGFVPATSIQTYRTYAYFMGNLLLKSYFKSENVYKALLSRGFKGYFPVFRHFKLRTADVIFFLTIAIYWGVAIWKFYL